MAEYDDELETEQGPVLASNDAEMPIPSAMPGPSAMPSMPAPMNPVLVNYLKNKQELKDAQTKVAQNDLITGLARAGASLSSGLAHSDAKVDDAPFQAMAVSDQAPIKNVMDAQKSEAANLENQQKFGAAQKQALDQDPSSPASMAKKALVQKLYPGKFSDEDLAQISAADIGESVLKPLELDSRIQASKEDRANRRADKLEAASDKRDTKSTTEQNNALTSTQQLLESARGNPAAAQAERDIYAASKARSLMNLYPDANQLSNEQVRLLASEVGKIASGGVPTQHELEGISPDTMKGKMAGIVSKFTNEPTRANAGEFIKRYQDYTDALTRDAQGYIQDKYGRVIETRKDQLGDANYQKLKTNYLDRFMNQQVPHAGGQSADLQGSVAAEMARRKAARAQPSVNMGAPVQSLNGVPSFLQPNQ